MTDLEEEFRPDRPAIQTTAQKVAAWRLKVVTAAYTEAASTFDDDVFGQLEALSLSAADLWQIRKSLVAGCPLAMAVEIFT